jgi:hypothetical protein
MKNFKKAALVLITLSLFVGGASKASAYDRDRNYSYGHNGYWDERDHHHYHHWDHYNGHDGYWHRRDDGVRVFIDI